MCNAGLYHQPYFPASLSLKVPNSQAYQGRSLGSSRISLRAYNGLPYGYDEGYGKGFRIGAFFNRVAQRGHPLEGFLVRIIA